MNKEKEKVEQIHHLQKQIEDDFMAKSLPAEALKNDNAPKLLGEDERKKIQSTLHKLMEELNTIQGDEPMIQVNVGSQAIAEVVANWTGIPVGKMVSDEIESIMNLSDALGKRVIGQPHALSAIAENIRTSRAGLTDPRKPIGVFFTYLSNKS